MSAGSPGGDRKPVLVTGASGFLGTRTVELLARSGRSVLAITSPGSKGLRASAISPNVEALALDLREPEKLAEVVRARGISEAIHLAAAGVLAPASWEDLLSVNVLALVAVARALSEMPDHFLVAAGSMSEYGSSPAPYLTTSTPLRPRTPYGVSKAAAALALGSLEAEARLRFALLRFFHVYGPGEAPGRLFSHVVSRLLEGKPAETTSLEQVRDLVYVDDAAHALILALEKKPGGAVANVATGRATSLREPVSWIADRLGRPELVRLGARPQRPGEVLRLVGGSLLLSEILDFRPRPWEEGLALTIDAAKAAAGAGLP